MTDTPDSPAPAETPPAVPVAATPPAPPARAPRWRRFLTGFLVVVGCVLVPVSILGVWVHNTLLDTNQYVDTVGPLADDPDIQQAVATRVANAVVEKSGIQDRIAAALPPAAGFVAPAVVDGLTRVVYNAALHVTESDKFSNLWKGINRSGHRLVLAVLEGKGRDTADSKAGAITAKLGPVIAKVKDALDKRGITVFDDAQGSQSNRRITLLKAKGLRKLQSGVDVLNTLAWVLPVLILLMFAGALGLSPNRRRTVLRGAVGVAIATGLLLVIFNAARHFYLDALPSSVNQAAAGSVYDQLLSFLRLSLRSAFVLALLVAIAAWVVGPGRLATRIRTSTQGAIRGDHVSATPSPAALFFAQHRMALRFAVVAIALIVLGALSAPSPAAVLTVAVLVVLGLLAIELVARSAPSIAAPPADE